MKYLVTFITDNFILICISIVLLINSIQYYKRQQRISLFSILIISGAVTLAIAQVLETLSKDSGNVVATSFFAFVGYTLRPVIIYLFILMSLKLKNRIYYLLMAIPLFINIIIYLLTFVPVVNMYVFTFVFGDDGSLSFHAGPLRFTSHIISALYLLFLIYVSLYRIRAKHLSHAIAILACAVFVVTSVVVETFFNNEGEIHLLNTTIGISALTYYLYSYIERTQFDALTKLFNRETYYHDLPRMDKTITGVIQYDLNGLKFINDHHGHLEGDKALFTVADIILQCSTKNMYAYRLGGDEFIVLAVNTSEEELLKSINSFKEILAKTSYFCSVGYSCRKEDKTPVLEMVKEAERNMYLEKEEFYKTAKFDRRKR